MAKSRANSRFRVLHVVPALALRTGGPAVSVSNLARVLQDKGHIVWVYSTDAATASQADDARGGVTLSELPPAAKEINLKLCPLVHPYRLAYSRELGQQLYSTISNFDVVHIHSLNLYPQFVAWRAATKANVPYVVSPRGALDPWILGRGKLRKKVVDLMWQRRMLNGASMLHLTTEEERRLILPLNIKAPTTVIANGLANREFHLLPPREEFRRKFLGGFSGPLLMNHGRIDRKKGLDVLVGALAEAKIAVPNLHLVLIGPDEYGLERTLMKQAEELGVTGAMTFPGALYGDCLKSALASADIWALPSHGENFGVAVAEAMAAGLPVITSPHVNLSLEAFAAGALTISENSASALSDTLVNLIQNVEMRRQLGARAREYALRFDWESVAEEYEEMYASIILSHEHHWPFKRVV